MTATEASPGVSPPVLSLEGRSALVTGGGTGLGKACATGLARAGARVTICGPDLDVLDGAAKQLADLGLPGVRTIMADVTNEELLAGAVEHASVDGHLDIAVANAGVAMPGSLLHLTTDHWMGPIGVNLLGTAFTIKHAARKMIGSGGGSIITMSSIASARPAAFLNAYSVTKSAVDGLTRAAAEELGRFNIRVNGVRPGWMRTEAMADSLSEANRTIIRKGTYLEPGERELWLGDPDDVARAVVYFASDYSGWVTGQLLAVCGGSSLPPTSGDFEDVARMLFAEDMVRDFGTDLIGDH
jgi:NAD(P)-dependent dehydrogenase (short-subunit alcohol dehydrogenase family)